MTQQPTDNPLSSRFSSAGVALSDGAGQCDVPIDITVNDAIRGMRTRGRDGQNKVTVTQQSSTSIQITVTVSGVGFIGLLGAVYMGDNKTGQHQLPEGTRACAGNADAITHSQPFAAGTKSFSWLFTVPAEANGTLDVRVITLNGVRHDGAGQTFALGRASIEVKGSGKTIVTSGGAITSEPTLSLSPGATTVTANSAEDTTESTSGVGSWHWQWKMTLLVGMVCLCLLDQDGSLMRSSVSG
jgi:hypothetical protein